jgi:protein-disulfide isomerase
MSKLRNFLSSIEHSISSFTLTTPKAIIIGAIIIGISHVAYGYVTSSTGSSAVSMFAGRPIDNTDFVEGKENAKVFVVEYSDPECPYCINLHPTLKQIRNEYADKVAFVYRHFPLTQIHPNAFDESKAIACAGKLGGKVGFYDYIDKLYGYKSETRQVQLPATGKEDIAGHVGLDKDAFLACLSDQSIADSIDASMQDGVQAGVQGTPSTFVLEKTRKGYEIVAFVDGARPYEYIKAAIDQALSQ